MTGSPPNGAAEHCTVGASATLIVLPVTYRYVAVTAAPVTRKDAEAEVEESDDKAFDGDADAFLLLEICLTRFPCFVARDISAVTVAFDRGWNARRRAEDDNIMVSFERSNLIDRNLSYRNIVSSRTRR